MADQYEIPLDSSQITAALQKVHGADTTPSLGSTDMVTSGGVATALAANTADIATNTAALAAFITDTATLDFPSISSNAQESLTMTVTGAAVGDTVMLGPPATIEAELSWSGFVSAADTVTIRVNHSHGGSINPASATWRVTVIKY